MAHSETSKPAGATQGRKTIAQRRRTLERKPDIPREGEPVSPRNGPRRYAPDRSARQSEFPVSRHGMNQESRHRKPPSG